MWSPSSLIFLVLLGVWAAYFLQYWIRRRDHLATARSVEQFSEAMRVLEQRDTTPRTDLSEPAPRSWNVHPTRPARPQVLVKRAVPAEPATPLVTARIQDGGADGPRAPRPAAADAPTAGSHRPPRREPAPVRSRVRPGRRVRSALMLVALVELVVIATLVPLGRLAPWALVPAVLALVASFVYVRAGVRAEQALRAARRRRYAEVHRRRAAAAPGERAARRRASSPARAGATSPGDAAPSATPDRSAAEDAAASGTESPEAPVGPEALPEVVVAEATDAEVEVAEEIEYVHLVDEDDIPLTWDPVPVPRPTYTMKARAERPEVPPAEVTPDPQPVALPEGEGFEERRVAGA